MDATIIANFKRRYRSAQYNGAQDLLHNDKYIYKIDQVTVMRYILSIWRTVTAETISSLWNNCGIFRDNQGNITPASVEKMEVEEALNTVVSELVGNPKQDLYK